MIDLNNVGDMSPSGDFDLIPESSHQTDWRRSGKDGAKWVAWKYILGVINE